MGFETKSEIKWNGKEVKILGKKAIGKSVFDVGLIIEGQAKSLAPVDIGQLRGSITTQTIDQGTASNGSEVIGKPDKELIAYVGTALEHGIYQEFGTKYMNAQPYLRPAIDLAQGKALTVIYQDCKFALKEYIS